jgi:hypothetical protein
MMTMKKFLTAALALIIASAFGAPTFSAEELHEKMPAEKPPEVKSMFFCGYCHILTYPRVIKKAHASWKSGKHSKVSCADCHYPPGTRNVEIPAHERIPTDEKGELEKKTEFEFMKTELEVLSRLVTILNMDETTVVRRPKIDDLSCTTSSCHPTTGEGEKGAYWTKKIDYTEFEREDRSKGIVTFVHDRHFDREKWVKGDVLHCNTCHYRQTEKKHFEVGKESCFLCHFGNNKFNEGLSKCSFCHTIPTKSLQRQKKEEATKEEEVKPITHQTLEEAKVPCWSCHRDALKGRGSVGKKLCFNCHDYDDQLVKKAEDQELMHQEHVAGQSARCFECHEPIEHVKVADYFEPVMENCAVCHENTHTYQKQLLTGNISEEVADTPSLMLAARTNCLGCHLKFEHNDRGQRVKRGSAEACVACHTKNHEAMLKEWKDKVAEWLEEAEEVEKEARSALEKAQGGLSEAAIRDAETRIKKARETLNIVKYGNGVHNKKYSLMLIDSAFGLFEDVIDNLEKEAP